MEEEKFMGDSIADNSAIGMTIDAPELSSSNTRLQIRDKEVRRGFHYEDGKFSVFLRWFWV